MNRFSALPDRKCDELRFVRPLVRSVLENWANHRWSLQGFGMLRAYLSGRKLRLHVWDSKFTIPGVTTIHDHPWNFESHVVAGRITNTRYRVHPCLHTEDDIERQKLRSPFVKARITCGTGGVNDVATMKAQGARVWLTPTEPETYEAGGTYRQEAHEVHHTSYEDGTVTLVSREFLPDTEHANVYFRADGSWVSAEPRDATPDEVSAIVERALLGFR
jgi:hypothetical protein